MPNGGSDCCGTCWFNRSLGGERGSGNFNRDIPGEREIRDLGGRGGEYVPTVLGGIRGHCEIRDLDIPSPFWTYCANHPYHRPNKDRIPIGPVYVHECEDGMDRRKEWQPSPDTEEIRQHLLDIVRLPEEHRDKGYHFYTHPANSAAIWQLLEWRDERLIGALEELARRPEMEGVRADILETVSLVRERFGGRSRPEAVTGN